MASATSIRHDCFIFLRKRNLHTFHYVYFSPQNDQLKEKRICCRLCPLLQKIILRYFGRPPSLSSIRQCAKTNYSIKYPLLSSHKIKYISFCILCVYCSPVFTAFKIIYWLIIYIKITHHYTYIYCRSLFDKEELVSPLKL